MPSPGGGKKSLLPIGHKSKAVISFCWLLKSSPRQLGQLLASTCKELPGPKESRRTAKELWEVVVQICSVSIQHKRNSDGRVGLIKHRESSMGILYRYAAVIVADLQNLPPKRSRCLFLFFFFPLPQFVTNSGANSSLSSRNCGSVAKRGTCFSTAGGTPSIGRF